eukprot:scaffold8.g1579.t1
MGYSQRRSSKVVPQAEGLRVEGGASGAPGGGDYVPQPPGPEGAQFALDDCVRNDGADYSHLRGAKFWWLMWWAAIYFYSVFYYSGWPLLTIFGKTKSWRIIMMQTIAASIASLCVIVGNVHFKLRIDHNYILLPFVLCHLLPQFFSGYAAFRHTRNWATYWRFMLIPVGTMPLTILYMALMSKIITARSGDSLNGLGIFIFRYFFHPVVWGLYIFFIRNVLRYLGPIPHLFHTILLTYPCIYLSIFGRFLLLQLSNVGSIVIQAMAQSAFMIAGALGDRERDGLFLKRMHGHRAALAVSAAPTVDGDELAFIFMESLAEYAGIIVVALVVPFAQISQTQQPPDRQQVWLNAILQILIQLVQDFCILSLKRKYHSFDWHTAYRAANGLGKLCFHQCFIWLFGSPVLAVEILSMFCPVYSPDTGVVMMPCDRPSIFQASPQGNCKPLGMEQMGLVNARNDNTFLIRRPSTLPSLRATQTTLLGGHWVSTLRLSRPEVAWQRYVSHNFPHCTFLRQ